MAQFLEGLDRQIQSPAAEAAAGPEGAAAPAERRTFAPAPTTARGTDPVVIAISVLAGFLLALIGVGVGRWTARR